MRPYKDDRLSVPLPGEDSVGKSGSVSMLFVCGPQRSGTTALVDYLNLHPEILLCMERYKWVQARDIQPGLFTFERILDYRMGPRGDRQETNTPREHHVKLLAQKDQERLKWVGDKNPAYVNHLAPIAESNPGARFIVTYRPLEEVAESFEARWKDAEDPWRMGGFESGVELWNEALRSARDFVEEAVNLNVLFLDYREFFRMDPAAISLLARFLEIEIDDALKETWRGMSRRFETDRRPKETLSDEQLSYIETHKNTEVESWVLDRIERQRRELELYTPEFARVLAEERSLAASRAAKDRASLRQLKRDNEKLGGWNRNLKRRLQKVRSKRKRQLETLRERNRRLEHQILDIRSSKTWRLLDRIGRLRKRLRGKP